MGSSGEADGDADVPREADRDADAPREAASGPDGAGLIDRVADCEGRPVSVYEDLAPLYDLVHAGDDHAARERLVAEVAPPSASRVLDAGCGTGRLLARLDDRYETAVGLDRSEGMLEVAAGRTDAPLIRADLREYVADDPFDAVVAFGNTLAHFVDDGDLAAALSRAAENLREGGVLLCDFESRAAFENGGVERTEVARGDLRVRRTVVSTLEDRPGIVRYAFAYELRGPDGESARTGESQRGRVFDPDALVDRAERSGFAEATVRTEPLRNAVLVARR